LRECRHGVRLSNGNSCQEAIIPAPIGSPNGRQDEIFVGRRAELGMLHAALDQVLAGRGRGILIAGEPGIGKTRTAQALAEYAVGQDALVLWGRCYEEAGAPSYWPWIQIIRAALATGDGDALLGELGSAARDIADIVPELHGRLSSGASASRLTDPAEARFSMFEAIRRLLADASEAHALVLVLDDLHWADAPSLRLLEFLAPEIADSRLLLVGTYRANELSRQHPLSDTLGGLARVPHVARVNLHGLSTEEVQAFIAAAAGTPTPNWFAQTLHRQTEGNPLFLREIDDPRHRERPRSRDGIPYFDDLLPAPVASPSTPINAPAYGRPRWTTTPLSNSRRPCAAG
jgi:predicted ATPase